MGIIVTGAVVRLTASGLGCPTWPECVPGSLTPTSAQTEGWHKYVEYGNRTLTGVLVIVAIATIWAARDSHRLARRLSWATLLGIVAQAVLGGITVLTGLNPLTVAAHFLVSTVLVAAAAILVWRAQDGVAPPVVVPPVIRSTVQAQTALGFLIVVVGTLVTGTGPHAGDSSDVPRLPFDWRTIAWLHADIAILFIGVSVGLMVALRAAGCDRTLVRRADTVVAVAAAQAGVGYLQVFTHLPWGLVAVHVVGAVALWVATLRVRLSVA